MVSAASRTTHTLPDVPDVLYHVFSYLDPVHQLDDDEAVYESRRSLAIAARTCQGFAGPALDVLWRLLPDDQPLADLLRALDIGEMEKPRQDLGRNKARRYQLPNQDDGGYRLSGAAEEYEERWRLSRGYDIKYVGPLRRYNASPRLTSVFFSEFAGHRRPPHASRVAAIHGVRFARPLYHLILVRWPIVVRDLGGSTVSYRRRSDPAEAFNGRLLPHLHASSYARRSRTHLPLHPQAELQPRERVHVAAAGGQAALLVLAELQLGPRDREAPTRIATLHPRLVSHPDALFLRAPPRSVPPARL